MRSMDLPLLLASDEARTGDEPFPLDRIRMQKAVFLLTQRGSAEWATLYRYEPYNWGPYSSALAQHVDELVFTGRIGVEKHAGGRYGSYQVTALGQQDALEAWVGLDPREQKFVRDVRAFVTNRSFQRLLRDVYAAFPEYATKSQFSG